MINTKNIAHKSKIFQKNNGKESVRSQTVFNEKKSYRIKINYIVETKSNECGA